MSSLDKVKMTLPDSTEFVASDNISVQIQQTPQWIFDGFGNVVAVKEQLDNTDGGLTEQVYLGAGARVRSFTIDFTQWEGSSDSWGSASASDDVMVKLVELDDALANTKMTSTNTATLEFSEYSSSGSKDPIEVVPGEMTLSVAFGPGESATTFRPTVQWLDAVDLDQTIDELKSSADSVVP
jgi:hypothetical protein